MNSVYDSAKISLGTEKSSQLSLSESYEWLSQTGEAAFESQG